MSDCLDFPLGSLRLLSCDLLVDLSVPSCQVYFRSIYFHKSFIYIALRSQVWHVFDRFVQNLTGKEMSFSSFLLHFGKRRWEGFHFSTHLFTLIVIIICSFCHLHRLLSENTVQKIGYSRRYKRSIKSIKSLITMIAARHCSSDVRCTAATISKLLFRVDWQRMYLPNEWEN